jgi:hypothetical protein
MPRVRGGLFFLFRFGVSRLEAEPVRQPVPEPPPELGN